VKIETKRGSVDIFGKSEFPVSPETENSHHLKGDKNVITLATTDHDCVQARLLWRVIRVKIKRANFLQYELLKQFFC